MHEKYGIIHAIRYTKQHVKHCTKTLRTIDFSYAFSYAFSCTFSSCSSYSNGFSYACSYAFSCAFSCAPSCAFSRTAATGAPTQLKWTPPRTPLPGPQPRLTNVCKTKQKREKNFMRLVCMSVQPDIYIYKYK